MLRGDRHKGRGQSLTEFALFLPVFLLIFLIALDFGRVYLGWVNMQQAARVAANFAADHASADWNDPDDPRTIRYRQMVRNEAELSNCTLPGEVPPPIVSGVLPGDQVEVAFDCQFNLITPLIGNVVGNPLTASASATFPVKEGIPGIGGSGPGTIGTSAPEANFVGSPRSGWGPLVVTFTDLSTGLPASWNWTFDLNATGAGDASPSTSTDAGPITVTYTCTGSPGDVCTFGVRLAVANTVDLDIETRNDYVTVIVPPDNGPIFDFTASPVTGEEPLAVSFAYVDRGGTPATSWSWDFGDGSAPGTGPTPSHTYANDGLYTVSLTASDGTDSNELIKADLIYVSEKICIVPSFATMHVNGSGQNPPPQDIWADAGFTGTLFKEPGNGNYRIRTQSILGGTIDPQPNGCASSITVGP